MTSLKFSANAATFAAVLLCATQAMGATWTLANGKYSKVSGRSTRPSTRSPSIPRRHST